MATTGIMEEIRDLLSKGKSTAEVIALGQKPPTVYKVQRQLRKQGNDTQSGPEAPLSHEPSQAEPQDEVAELRQHIATLEAELAEAHSPRFQLDQAQARIEELETEAKNTATLTKRLGMVQEEAQSWQSKAAEALHTLTDAQRQLVAAQAIIQTLKPLTVWAGHPCCVCEEATDGVLDRESAAKLLERVGHRRCLEHSGLKGITFRSLALPTRAAVLADEPESPRAFLVTY
jgi:DNA repair exonuclease SbcCD ATPase subunit